MGGRGTKSGGGGGGGGGVAADGDGGYLGQSVGGFTGKVVGETGDLDLLVAQSMIKRWFGLQRLPYADLGALAGAHGTEKVIVAASGAQQTVTLTVMGGKATAIRQITANGIENVSLHAHEVGGGIGARMLAQQVSTAERLGIRQIKLDAAGAGPLHPTHDREAANGYYTWARLGFNTDFGPILRSRTEAGLTTPRQFASAKTLHDVLRTPGGAEWWRANGQAFSGAFTIAKGSDSRKILSGYLQMKGY